MGVSDKKLGFWGNKKKPERSSSRRFNRLFMALLVFSTYLALCQIFCQLFSIDAPAFSI